MGDERRLADDVIEFERVASARDESASLSADRKRVIELLDAARPQLVDRICEEVAPNIDSHETYGAVPEMERRGVIDTAIQLVIDALDADRLPNAAELELVAAVGELRARQGVPSDAVIGTVRAGALGALELVQQLASQEQIGTEATMDLIRCLWLWMDAVSATLVDAQRRVDAEEIGRNHDQRSAFLHSVVLGKLDRLQLQNGAAAIGIGPDEPVRAARMRPPPDALFRVVSELPRSARHGCITGVLGADVVALFTTEPPDISVPGGIGPRVPLTQAARSFRSASLALDAAAAFGMSGWHTLGTVATRVAVLENYEVGDVLVETMLREIHSEGDFGDELIHTLRVWWAHGQRVADAASELCVHPNTLRHRLARIEALTGGTLSDVEHTVALWWALAREETRPGPARRGPG